MRTLQEAVENLIGGILAYCSDTFDAGMQCLTREEAEAIAARLIEHHLIDENQCPGLDIDGVVLQELLEEVRGE